MPSPLLDLPALATSAPDAHAAEAALDAAMPPEPHDAPSADAAGDAPPTSADASPAASPPKRGPGRPAADKWSDRKLSKSSRAELRARVKELQERSAAPSTAAPADAPTPEDAPAPPLDPAELVPPLALTFQTLGTLAATVYGDHWKVNDEEARLLGSAWAPLAARYAASAGPAMPWALALLTTVGVVAPKLKAHADAQRLAGASEASSELPPPLRGPDA